MPVRCELWNAFRKAGEMPRWHMRLPDSIAPTQISARTLRRHSPAPLFKVAMAVRLRQDRIVAAQPPFPFRQTRGEDDLDRRWPSMHPAGEAMPPTIPGICTSGNTTYYCGSIVPELRLPSRIESSPDTTLPHPSAVAFLAAKGIHLPPKDSSPRAFLSQSLPCTQPLIPARARSVTERRRLRRRTRRSVWSHSPSARTSSCR
jgi:hypothetical protein